MYKSKNLIRRQIILVDRQGAIKTRKSPMHPTVIFKQHFGLIIVAWIAFILFFIITTKVDPLKLKKEPKQGVNSYYFEENRKVIRAGH